MKNQNQTEAKKSSEKNKDDRFQPVFPPIFEIDEIPIDVSLPKLLIREIKCIGNRIFITLENPQNISIDIYLYKNKSKIDLFYHCNKAIVTFNNVLSYELDEFEAFYVIGNRRSESVTIHDKNQLGSNHERSSKSTGEVSL